MEQLLRQDIKYETHFISAWDVVVVQPGVYWITWMMNGTRYRSLVIGAHFSSKGGDQFWYHLVATGRMVYWGAPPPGKDEIYLDKFEWNLKALWNPGHRVIDGTLIRDHGQTYDLGYYEPDLVLVNVANAMWNWQKQLWWVPLREDVVLCWQAKPPADVLACRGIL